MKTRFLTITIFSMFSLWLSCPAFALDGEPFIHDPSTIMECNGKYYTYGTGGGGLVSDDGWTWRSGNRLPQSGAAPDAILIGDMYIIAIGATGGGLGGGHNGTILTLLNKTLDPQSPDYKFSEAVAVASSDGIEDCDAIDPGLCMGPDGRLWCTYGTFFGFTRIVELDPKTGKRVEGNQAVNIAIDCEATTMIYRDGWYYLFGTHGTCCNGVTSTYNIRVGRSKSVTGPFLDNMGTDMLKGGGKLVVAANGRYIGPGHFGLIDLGNGIQKFSCHYEADLDRGGRSILDIRTLLWKNGWPVAGEDFRGGTFEIESERSGYALELGVEAVPLSGGRGMGMGMGMGGRGARGPATPIPDQNVADVSKNWPDRNLDIRMGNYMLHAHQKWTITPVAEAGGYLGSPYFKITIAGTDRTLAMTENTELVGLTTFTGRLEQLWRIDQLIDGTYRITPKALPDYALTAVGVTTPSLAKFDPDSDKARWNFRKP
ncbi:MAG: family 43 glycosylhydrolase [Sedimentisphaerales bacterium]|nr:family 43 glycosylhydrolase [Sedimentisphaerales bacterium]